MPTVLQYTNHADGLGDSIVTETGGVYTVETDGVPNASAIVTIEDSQVRLDVEGKNIINANTIPLLGEITLTRVPGFSGSVGWRCTLDDWAEGETPNAIAIGVYSGPNATGYLWTTGGFIWDAVEEEWYVECAPGFEPAAGADFYLAFLYGSLPVSPFTYFDSYGGSVGDSQTFSGGGDWP